MSEVNTFLDTIGSDVSATVVPKVHDFLTTLTQDVSATAVPKVHDFLTTLTQDVSATVVPRVHDFLKALIEDLSHRYRPELVGELHTRIVAGGLEVTGQGVRLDVKRRDTGAPVSSLDIPVALKIHVDAVGVTLSDTTIRLDVVK